jgi:8-oxo-dGTP pyrophosphatase MutT (NUDIX family)
MGSGPARHRTIDRVPIMDDVDRNVNPAGTAAPGSPGRGGRQVIPRPAGWRPGRPAPWAALPPSSRRGLALSRVMAAVEASQPGTLEEPRVVFDGFPDPGSSSAVLVALFEEDGETRVVLTRRAAHLRSHRGEVSFPGGRLDPGEAPEDGARREAEEEIALDSGSVTVVGRLSELSTLSSSSRITPVVGVLPGRPAVQPNPSEVARVFDESLATLAGDDLFREEHWIRPGAPAPAHVVSHLAEDGSFPVWFFELPDDTVWGATARMLVELLRLVLGV